MKQIEIMHDKSRLSRLTAIVIQLQSKMLVTASEIAQKHGVSVRTIYRDIRALEQAGVPVFTEEGKGYSIMEGYSLPPVMFTQQEANALITAGYLIRENSDKSLVKNYDNAVQKIKAVLRSVQKKKAEVISNRIHVRGNSWKLNKSQYLIQVQDAIASYQLMAIEYLSLQGVETKRTLEPFAIYSTQGNWLLIAFCRLRNEFRSFRLDLIQDIQMINDYFEPHKMTLQEYFTLCREKSQTTPDIPLSQGAFNFEVNHKNRKMEKVQVTAFSVIGISVRTSNKEGVAARDIPALWNRFMSENCMEAIPNKVDQTIYSLYTEYEGDHSEPYTTIIGCRVSSLEKIPEGMVGKSFEAGHYQKMTINGDLTKGLVINQWLKIWEMDLKRRYTVDFEAYGEKAMDPTNAEVGIFVAVD